MSRFDTLTGALAQLEARAGEVRLAASYLAGEQPAAFLSKKSREALDKRLGRLGVNFPRLIVNSRVERLQPTGFAIGGADPDPDLWSMFRRAGLVRLADLVHTDYLGLGAAYVTVWPAMRAGRSTPTATVDNGLTMHVERDPATLEPLHAVRRWTVAGKAGSNTTRAVLLEPDRITAYRTTTPDAYATGAWVAESVTDNPLGLVPVVPFIRRAHSGDRHGTPAVADIRDLTDAHAKVLADSMVSSEYYARPRRWATGLEIEEDENGNAVDPFGESRFLHSESSDTKFGQLEASRADGYADLLAVLTQSIGALSGLPAHYLGLHGDQPANAESLRAAEAQLVAMCYSDHRQLGPDWAEVVALLHALTRPDGDDLDPMDIGTVWASPEARTPAQSADAAAKLAGIGVPLRSLLADPLGYDPDAIEEIMGAQRDDQLRRAALDLSKVLP